MCARAVQLYDENQFNASQIPTTDTPVVYPSVWLTAHPHQKPIIKIIEGVNVAGAHHRLIQMGDYWNDLTVSTFLCKVLEENIAKFTATPNTNWTANGRLLGAEAQAMTPFNLVDIHEIPGVAVPGPVVGETPVVRLHKFLGLLSIYRKFIARDIRYSYGGYISTKLDNFLVSSKFHVSQETLRDLHVYISSNSLTPNYLKVIAMIDMFLFKHSDLEISSIRILTLPSRYKGCTAFTSYGYMAECLGVDTEDLAKFILTKQVAKEFYSMCAPGQGEGDPNSYFPYQLDFGLSSKSAYSISANPNLYLWTHTIGFVLGVDRSINAMAPSGKIVFGETINSAAMVASRISGISTFSMQIVTAGREDEYRAAMANLQRMRQQMDQRTIGCVLGDDRSIKEMAPSVKRDSGPTNNSAAMVASRISGEPTFFTQFVAPGRQDVYRAAKTNFQRMRQQMDQGNAAGGEADPEEAAADDNENPNLNQPEDGAPIMPHEPEDRMQSLSNKILIELTLYGGLPDTVKKEIIRRFRPRRYKKGSIGEVVSNFYKA